jgi:hypothetical protein
MVNGQWSMVNGEIIHTPFGANNLITVVKTGAYKRAGKAAVRIINGQLAMDNGQNQEPKTPKKHKNSKTKTKIQMPIALILVYI